MREYEMEYDTLRLDFKEMSVAADKTKALLSVYYSGNWTASILEDTDWAELETTSGSGITANRVLMRKNTGPSRKTVITVKADNGNVWTVDLTQKAASGAYLKFDEDALTLPAESFELSIPVVTNMGEEYVSRMFAGFVGDAYAGAVSYELSEPEIIEEGVTRRILSVDLSENESGQPREIELIANLEGTVFGDTLNIFQHAEKAFLNVSESSILVNRFAADRSFTVEHNLGSLTDSVKVSSQDEFLSGLDFDDGAVSYSISETETERTAVISMSIDALGISIEKSVSITQVTELQPRTIDASALKSLFTEGSHEYAPEDIYKDNVELYVIGGAGNPNMDQNINTGPNEITTDENDRTVYMQDAASGAVHGFRVKFADPEDNTLKDLKHGDKIRLELMGTTLIRESDPERYTIDGLKVSNVEVLESENEIRPNVRTISSLTSADVYTYCTLEGLEFQVKKGKVANIRETATGSMDGAANLLYDGDGNGIYLLVNTACDWRRNDIPQGECNLSGVIVNQYMPRWGGNMGSYSIRPLKTDDIEDKGGDSGWTSLAEWVLDKNTVSTGEYTWKHGPDNEEGYSGISGVDLVQNKMKATDGSDAWLYSENLDGHLAKTSIHQKSATPVTLEYGYRGSRVDENEGMSTGSALMFWGNASGWFQWDGSSRIQDKYNGLVMEFSTSSVSSASYVSVGFSTAAGYVSGTGEPAPQSMSSFPVYWTVEYSVGDSDTWTEVDNSATMNAGFEMRSVPGTMKAISKAPHYLTTTKIPIDTQCDTGFVFVPYRFTLPPEILGKSKVRVRIRPSSDIIMTFNEDWKAGLTSEQLHAVAQSKQVTNVNHGVILEDVMIQYR